MDEDGLAAIELLQRVAFDEVGGALGIGQGQGVGDCFGDESLELAPLAGSPVQGLYLLGGGLGQSLAELVGKEAVVAIPLPPVVEWDGKEVGLFQVFQDGLYCFPSIESSKRKH